MGKIFGILSLILWITGLVVSPMYYIVMIGPSFLWFLALVAAIPGIIFGALGIKKDDRANLAIAGLVISSVAIIMWIGIMVYPDFIRDVLFLL